MGRNLKNLHYNSIFNTMEYKIDDNSAGCSLSLDFKPASLSALEDFQRCALVNNFFANNYSALNCFLYQKKFSSKVCLWKDWLLELYEACGKFCFSFPHNMKGDYSAVQEAFELLYALAKEAGQSLYFHNVTKEEKDLLLSAFPQAIVVQDQALGDYIYLREKLALLSGKKLSKKRNHIHQFEKIYPDYEFELLSAENLPRAVTLYDVNRYFLDFLVGRETAAAFQTFPAPPYLLVILGRP